MDAGARAAAHLLGLWGSLSWTLAVLPTAPKTSFGAVIGVAGRLWMQLGIPLECIRTTFDPVWCSRLPSPRLPPVSAAMSVRTALVIGRCHNMETRWRMGLGSIQARLTGHSQVESGETMGTWMSKDGLDRGHP